MRNAKKILLFALALVALTLVMSLSIFAATTHEVATKAELNAAYASAQDGDTILLTADITCKCFYNSGDCVNGFMTITKAITLDLGGNTLELQNGWGGLRLKNSGCSVVNGKLLHTGRTCAIKVFSAKSIENLEIHIKYDGAGGAKTIGGIVLQEGGGSIETIKNVYIHDTDTSDVTTTRGIESNKNGTITTPLISNMENVTIDVRTTGILLTGGKLGTFTNCSISGGVTGIEFDTKDNPSYSCSVDLEDCTVYGGSQTIYSHSNNKNGNVNIEADSQTELTTGESGKVFAVSHTSIIKDFEVPGYAQNDDGSIAACTEHTWVDATCTSPKTCSKCNATEGKALPHTYEITEKVEAKPGKEGYIKETCTICGNVKTTKIEALPEQHTHTPVEIPAVLPTPSTQGFTAGVKCSECDAVIVAPVAVEVLVTPDYNVFGISTINLTLSDNISINYRSLVPSEYKNAYMVFVFEDVEYIVSEYEVDSGRYKFNFAETRPHKMASNINAYLYAEKDGSYYYDNIPVYSILQYCEGELGKNEAKITKLISDLLVYGAAVQKYVNNNISDAELVTTIVSKKYTLQPTAFTEIPEQSVKYAITGIEPEGTLWWSTSLMMGSTTEMYYKFKSDDISGLSIRVQIEGHKDRIYTAEDFRVEGDKYVISVDYLTATQYGKAISATFIKDGVESGTFTDSINRYLKTAVGSYSGATLELSKALYVYGESVLAYTK